MKTGMISFRECHTVNGPFTLQFNMCTDTLFLCTISSCAYICLCICVRVFAFMGFVACDLGYNVCAQHIT